jgi:hypothetical protein
LKVYDMLGREVQTLINETKQPGTYQALFNGTNLSGGVYIYKLSSNKNTSVNKMILLK